MAQGSYEMDLILLQFQYMKHAIFITLFCLASICRVYCQSSTGPASLLQAYYDIKCALVNGDARTAMEKSGALANASTAANSDKATPFDTYIINMQASARKISGANDLVTQRVYFAALSSDMYALLKCYQLSKEPVYRFYCPMKKVYWLSNVQTINNPYYGRAMLTCGSVTETIPPLK
jgi:hypothetical protein